MGKRVYGQYCGFARALELVGERWALMIVRDLLVSPKRFSELQRGLPGIPSNVLAARLKEMEAAGIVERRLALRSSRILYELTGTGAALEPAVTELGRWGAKLLGPPGEGEVLTLDALVTALRSTFQAKAAKGVTVSYELRVGTMVVNARIARGRLAVRAAPLPEADLAIEVGPTLRDLLAGELSPRKALSAGLVKIRGNRALLDRFVELFRI
ncbi:MAG TPA: winged helix-turn-helix transcriptional regulator [Candidatus Tumulicola sp.]